MTNRNAQWNSIQQDIEITPDDAGLELTTSLYMKIDDGIVPNWDPNEISSINAQIRIDHSEGSTYLNCLFGCAVPDGQWNFMQANCDPVPDGLSDITSTNFFISGLVANSGPLDFYVDDVKLGPFQRDRSWIPDANLRIEDIRKRDLLIDIENRNDINHIKEQIL